LKISDRVAAKSGGYCYYIPRVEGDWWLFFFCFEMVIFNFSYCVSCYFCL